MTDETFESRRKRALQRRSADLGLRRVPGRPVWGVVMETGTKDGVTTVVATDDGAASLLTSAGVSVYLAKDEWPCGAGARFIGAACDFLFECSPAWAHPLPANGMVRFYLLTFDGVMTTEAPARDLVAGERPLADLYYAGHDVQFLTQLVHENPNWRSYKPAAGQASVLGEAPAAATTETAAEVPDRIMSGPTLQENAPPQAPMEKPPADEAATAGTPGNDHLLRAAANNDVEEVAKLLAQGCDSGPNVMGVTPLMAAAHAGALEPLRLLLAAGVPVDAQDSHGFTALMLACNAGHEVCARLLLGAGADVHARDDEGFTSLMFAAKNGHNHIVRLLMERGADPAATNDAGLSAVNLATQKGHTQTASILLGRQSP